MAYQIVAVLMTLNDLQGHARNGDTVMQQLLLQCFTLSCKRQDLSNEDKRRL